MGLQVRGSGFRVSGFRSVVLGCSVSGLGVRGEGLDPVSIVPVIGRKSLSCQGDNFSAREIKSCQIGNMSRQFSASIGNCISKINGLVTAPRRDW